MQRRQISLVKLAMRWKLWVAAIPLVMGGIFVAVGQHQGAQADLLASEGVQAQAEITDRELRTRYDNDGDVQTYYYVTYRFSLTDGGTQTVRESVGRGFYGSVREGDVMPVRYLPDDPTVSEIDPGSTRMQARIFGGVGIGLAGLGVGLGVWFGRRAAGAFRAARSGEMRQARVLSHRETNTTVNNRPMWRLHWRDESGQDGQSALNRYDKLIDYPPESAITVRVDPKTGEGYWEEDIAPSS